MLKFKLSLVLAVLALTISSSKPVLADDGTVTIPTGVNQGLIFNTPAPEDLLTRLNFESPTVDLASTSISMDPPQLIPPLDQLQISLTLTPTSTPIPTPTSPPSPNLTKPTAPISQLSPTPSPSPTSTPIPISQTNSRADQLFTMVNNYRSTKSLPALVKDDRACTVANTRAPQIAGELASGTLHKGIRDMNLPYWNSENAIAYSTVEESFNWWINDAIHREAILGDYKYSCVACSGIDCVEEFTNFQPK